MKVRFTNCVYRNCKRTIPIWYLLKPQFKKYWMGQLWNVGLNGWYFVIDFRKINNIQDFSDALKYPNVWRILKDLSLIHI